MADAKKSRPISIYRSLFTHLGLLAVVAVALFSAGYVYYGVRPVAASIAESKFDDAVRSVNASLERLFQPVDLLIAISRDWAVTPGFDVENVAAFNRLFQPLLRQEHEVTSVVVGSTAGQGWLLLRLRPGATV